MSMLVVACDFGGNDQKLLIDFERTDELLDGRLFVSEWQVVEGEEIVLPLPKGNYLYDFTVDWGDGTIEDITSTLPAEGVRHSYRQAGRYQIVIDGLVEAWSFWRNPISKDNLLKVNSLGAVGWKSLFGAFSDCQRLTVVGGGDVSEVTDMSFMFNAAPLVVVDVGSWQTGNTRRMSFMFEGATLVDPDVSRWDTRQVQDLSYMFVGAVSAQPDVSAWDTSQVTEMQGMFNGAERADPDVSNWDTTKVRNLSYMFRQTAANPDVSRWNTANVISMAGMFSETSQARPEVSNWNTANVRDFSNMFKQAQLADPNVSCWNTGRAVDLHNMFHEAVRAVPDVGGWNVAGVIDMRGTFNGAQLAVPDTSQWNFASARQMDDMFKGLSLPTSLYSKVLQQLVATSQQRDVVLDGGDSYYNEKARAARARLVANGWQITDAGLAD